MDREARHAAIHGVTKSRTRLSDWTELNWVVNAFLLGGGRAVGRGFLLFLKSKRLNSHVKTVLPCTQRKITWLSSKIEISSKVPQLRLRKLYTKNSIQTDLAKILSSFFLLVMQAAMSAMCVRVLPSEASYSIFNEIYLYLFSQYLQTIIFITVLFLHIVEY